MVSSGEVLTWLITGEISCEDLVHWIQSDKNNNDKVINERLSQQSEETRRGLVPYFLNFLREETVAHTHPQPTGTGVGQSTATPSATAANARAPIINGKPFLR